jgi:hypothetical protein
MAHYDELREDIYKQQRENDRRRAEQDKRRKKLDKNKTT